MKQGKVGSPGAVVGAVAKNLRDDIGGAKHFRAIRQDFRALGGVIGVRITGFDTRASLNDDLEPALRQRGDHRGHQRHAPLPRKRFAGNTSNHEPSITSFHNRPKAYTETVSMSGEVCDWAVNGGNVRGSAYLLLTISKHG